MQSKRVSWLRKAIVVDPNQAILEGILGELNLHTVCHEARCPNRMECFARRTATFMILGTNCTRDCRFCGVLCAPPQPPDPDEPQRIARAVARLNLAYIVITSVTRDDLPDGGAAHFAATIAAIRASAPQTAIEVLIPDFGGNPAALAAVTQANPDVISHNMETVAPLYAKVRPQADYRRSLALLAEIKRLHPAIHSKTGIMLGLGETKPQVLALFDDLRAAGCEFLTIGQYLAPSREHLPVTEYIPPEMFDKYAALARQKGFSFVASAPFVRSSYHAGEALGL